MHRSTATTTLSHSEGDATLKTHKAVNNDRPYRKAWESNWNWKLRNILQGGSLKTEEELDHSRVHAAGSFPAIVRLLVHVELTKSLETPGSIPERAPDTVGTFMRNRFSPGFSIFSSLITKKLICSVRDGFRLLRTLSLSACKPPESEPLQPKKQAAVFDQISRRKTERCENEHSTSGIKIGNIFKDLSVSCCKNIPSGAPWTTVLTDIMTFPNRNETCLCCQLWLKG